MIVYDVATKVLDTEPFPQHNIAGLISGITCIVLFQSGEASTVEGNKHTHTHRSRPTSHVASKMEFFVTVVNNWFTFDFSDL